MFCKILTIWYRLRSNQTQKENASLGKQKWVSFNIYPKLNRNSTWYGSHPLLHQMRHLFRMADVQITILDFLFCWWMGKENRFFILSVMAQELHAIQISIATLEATFSNDNRVFLKVETT